MPETEPASAATVDLDAAQRAVLDLGEAESAVVLGAPGSGKTTALVELVAHRVAAQGFSADEILALTATRTAATELRDRLAVRLGAVSTGALARTVPALAFELVRESAQRRGAPSPRLLTGAEHDLLLRELLEGHDELGLGPDWPSPLDPAVRRTSTFRTELRELLMRATERGLSDAQLADLGRTLDRPEWVAAAEFRTEYRQVLAIDAPDALDPAELLAGATQALASGELGERLSAVRLVVVDDLPQLGEGALRVLEGFAARGVAVVAFGDPDLASEGFRGGEADALSALDRRLGGVTRLTLEQVHRHPEAVRRLVREVTARIGSAGAGTQRAARSAPVFEAGSDAGVLSLEAPSGAALATGIARELRERRLRSGLGWRDLVVVVRSGASIPALARSLTVAGVPTRTLAAGAPLRESPAAVALLRLVEIATGRRTLDGPLAHEILTGPYGGLDEIGARRLRLALRGIEIENGGDRAAGDLLADAIAAPGRLTLVDHHVGRAAERMAELLEKLRVQHAAGGSIEELLWTAWEGSRVAEDWRRQALGAGLAAEEASRALDVVVALFSAARRAVERDPSERPDSFLDAVLDAEVPEDTLAARSDDDAVLVTTASGVVAREYDTVVVTGLQEGAWPNLRPRGSLLGAQALVEHLAGVPADRDHLDVRRAVLADELRLFALATSRARSRVLIAAVASDDEVPSALYRLAADADRTGARPVEADPLPLHLRPLVGRLRRALTSDSDRLIPAPAAAAALRRLAEEEVPGADPLGWRGLQEPSTTAPLYDLSGADERIPVSPSQIETIERSPAEWFVSHHGGGSSSVLTGIGTLIHDVLEHATTSDAEELWAALEARWGELAMEAPWENERQRVHARRAIDALAEYLADAEHDRVELVSAEDDVLVDVDPARLRGKIDRVESRGGEIRIVDLKTGTVIGPKDAQEHPQLGAYQLAYADGELDGLPEGHRPGGAALLFTKSGMRGKKYTVRAQDAFDAEQLDEFRERVRRAARAIAGAAFDAVPVDDDWAYGGEIRRVIDPGEVSGG